MTPARLEPPALRLLWITGPPGAGKSEVAWRIFTELARSRKAAYVDIDQLGICCPEPVDDRWRHRLKARNLGALARSVAQVGATGLVVSGVIDPALRPCLEDLGDVDLTLVRLRATPEVLRQRLTTRDGSESAGFNGLDGYADELDRSGLGDLSIDTSALTVDEVARRIWQETARWPGAARTDRQLPPPGPPSRPGPDGQVASLIGATGSGKSTVGWELFQAALRSGTGAAFIDLDQIGFVLPDRSDDLERHRRQARLLAAIWAAYQDVGAQHLVVVGTVQDAAAIDEYRHVLSGSGLTICRLHASSLDLALRIAQRARGAGPRLAGDLLLGAPPSRLRAIAARASDDAERMDRESLGDIRIDTSGLSVAEVVGQALATLTGWPASGSAIR